MTSALWKNVLKDISKTKARFISIMLIVALGVGFFTGIKAVSPSMNYTVENYYRDNNLMDIRLLSTVGFNDRDVEEVKKLPHVRSVAASYYTDVIEGDDTGRVIRLYSNILEDENGITINQPLVKEGRLPENPGEIALENANFNSGDYRIGDTFTISPEAGKDNVEDILEHTEYTVVGFVQSPLYVSFERGTTTVGNGSIHMFGIISEEEFKSDRYTQLYVLTDYSDGSMNTLSSEYDELVAQLEEQFTDLGAERANDFDSEYLDDAKEKLREAQEELDSEKAKAEEELQDAENKLQDGETEYNDKIAEAEQELIDAENAISEGESLIEQGWEEYNSGIEEGENQLDSARTQMKDGQESLNTGKSEFDSKIREAERQLNEAERQYNSGLAEYNQAVSDFQLQTLPARLAIAALQSSYDLKLNRYENITKPACEDIINAAQSEVDGYNAQIEELQSKIDSSESEAEKLYLRTQIGILENLRDTNQRIIDRENKKIEDSKKEVDDAKQALDDATEEYNNQIAEPQRQLDEAKAQLDSAKQQIDSGRAELEAQRASGQAQLDDSQSQLNDAQEQITSGQAELSSQKTEGKATLKESEEELKKAREEYENGKAEFEKKKEEGRKELDDARAKYESAKTEAEETINDAQTKIDKAREALESLENPKWYFFTRLDNPGYQSLIDDTTRIDAVATVFPLFFLLVAALVCLTTMTRHVEEKRTEIGTLKALGYSNGSIQAQFVFYASCAAIVGCILGVAVGMLTLPKIIYNAYGIMYELIDLEIVVPVKIAVIGAAVAFVCTTLVAIYTCQKSLREKPSSLMRPKAPKIAKRILLERIPFLWSRMNFTSKVTARNIFRYKIRFLMTVIGVAGCTALILTGFGLKNSIASITEMQFGEIYTYDMTAVLKEEGTAHERADILNAVLDSGYVDSAMFDRQTAISVMNTDGGNKQDDIYLLVPQSAEDLKNIIHLRDRKSGNEIELTDSGIVLTEKAASNLGVSSGDSVIIEDDHRKYTVKVSGVSENYVNGYVFITPEYYKEVYGKAPLFNLIVAKMNEATDENESKLGVKCLDNDGIIAVSFMSDNINTFLDTIKSLDTVILVLIVCAGLLAVVVLYNLTNINIAERVREIATIKVLGFYNDETASFVYRENIVLTLCGIISGLGLGIILHRFVILTIEVNKAMFSRTISPWSFLFAAVLTAVFAALVNFIMYFKIKEIDMVESLKSIE